MQILMGKSQSLHRIKVATCEGFHIPPSPATFELTFILEQLSQVSNVVMSKEDNYWSILDNIIISPEIENEPDREFLGLGTSEAHYERLMDERNEPNEQIGPDRWIGQNEQIGPNEQKGPNEQIGQNGLIDLNSPDKPDYASRSWQPDKIKITYEDLKDHYWKNHAKIPNNRTIEDGKGKKIKSWMRVENEEINILIEGSSILTDDELFAIVVVIREKNACKEVVKLKHGHERFVKGEVQLKQSIKTINPATWRLTVKLDSIFYVNEDGIQKECYALSTSNTKVTNMFQLRTDVYSRRENNVGKIDDYLVGTKMSTPFLLKSDAEKRQDFSKIKRKRAHQDGYLKFKNEDDHNERREQIGPNGPVGANKHIGLNEQIELSSPDTPNAEFNDLKAKRAWFDSFHAKTMKVAGRDVGYHIRIPHKTGKEKEGDVVVLLEDENRQTYMELLDKNNFKGATLAGVITRSFYIEGMYPQDNTETDVIAVIGIVNVCVLGPVRSGDRLFACPKQSGCAATLATIALDKQDEDHSPFLLGQALESKPDVAVNEKCLVSSFVSLVNGIDYSAMEKRMITAEWRLTQTIKQSVEQAKSSIKKRMFWVLGILMVLLAAISLSLWQRYGSNTLLRKSICKRGSYEERTMVLEVSNSWQFIRFTGLEFKFGQLNAQLHKKITRRRGNVRYFINYDRCCNRGISYGNEYVDDTPIVAGPEVLSADLECSPGSVKYFIAGRWIPLIKNGRHVKIMTCHGHL